MTTNKYIARLKAQLDQTIVQREHWKQLAENRNSIVVTEVCPESRSVEEYVIDADSVRASWRLIRRYREQSEALREECEHLKASQENAMLHMTGLVAERDTQRQQIAERDATIERLEAGIPRLQEHAHQMRQQRDKLAGLLREVRVIVAREVERWTRSAAILPVNANVESGLLTRIDAALAEVKPCPESLHPAAT